MATIRNPKAPRFAGGKFVAAKAKENKKFAKGGFNNGSNRPPRPPKYK